jgi:tetratricopeptide (TPR) repeat protein
MYHSKKRAINMFVFLWFGCNVIFLTMPVSCHGLTYTAVFKKVRGVTDTIFLGVNRSSLFDGEDHLGRMFTVYLEAEQRLNLAVSLDCIRKMGLSRKPPVTGETSQADWEKHAVDLEDRKDWKGMLNWCRKWAKSDPNNFKAWFGLGAAYANIDKHDDAIEAYLRALSIDPETANAWYNLGYSYFRLNLYNNAVEAYSQALRIDPEMTNAWYNLGAAYAKLNRYDDAIKAFFQSQSMDPEFFNKLFNQTIIH